MTRSFAYADAEFEPPTPAGDRRKGAEVIPFTAPPAAAPVVRSGSPYSALKIFFHPEKIAELRAGRQPAPLQVQVILSDLCNQNCSFCAYRMDGYTSNAWFGVKDAHGVVNNNPKRFLPYPKVLEVLDDCVEMRIPAVQYTGGGEPTVHPQHAEVFDETFKRGLDLALVTNGVRLTPRVIEMLADAKWVRISLDAGNDTTYARIRRTEPSFFRRVLGHVSAIAKVRRPGTELVLGVGFVVTRDNWREVVDAARLAREHGADNFRISAVFQPEDAAYFQEFHERAAALAREAEALATGTFTVANMFGDRVEDLSQSHPDYSFCGYQQLHTYIGADMRIYRCCNLAYNPRGFVGSIAEQRFKDVWQSPGKRQDYAGFDARTCPRCQFNNKNRTIISAMEIPRHLNFI